jgi:hypothetical protein
MEIGNKYELYHAANIFGGTWSSQTGRTYINELNNIIGMKWLPRPIRQVYRDPYLAVSDYLKLCGNGTEIHFYHQNPWIILAGAV